jgi:hypothetical protein
MLDLILGLHLLSQHYPAEGLENRTPGVYVRTEEGWTAGAYRNSWARPSFYFGKVWAWEPHPSFDLAFTLALASGYQKRREAVSCDRVPASLGSFTHSCWIETGYSSTPLTILAAPSFRVGPMRIAGLPRTARGAAVVHLSVEGRF